MTDTLEVFGTEYTNVAGVRNYLKKLTSRMSALQTRPLPWSVKHFQR